MKENIINKNQIVLTRVAVVIFLLFLLLSLIVAGYTYAYFSQSSSSFTNVFTVGTVDVNLVPENGEAAVRVINGCEEYKWLLKNVGTKSSYVRAKVVRTEIEVDGETAWALDHSGNNIVNSFKERGLSNKWGWVNGYVIGEETTYTLWAGAGNNVLGNGEEVGLVRIKTLYDDDSNPDFLKITYEMINSFTMSEMHFYIDTVEPSWPVAPGQFPYKSVFSDDKNNFKFKIELDLINNGNFKNGDYLIMAAHAVVANDDVSQYMYQPSSLGEDCEDNWFWWHEEGDDYGYWYYWDLGWDAMKKIVAGDELELCLLMCPLGSDNRSYKFHIEVEAIQSTNEAYKAWPKRVWENLPAD